MRHLGGEAKRQHDTTDTLGAECVDRDRRAQRGVDAAGYTHQHAGKSVLSDIVAQAQHAGRVVGLVALQDRCNRSGAAPAGLTLGPAQRRDALLKRRQLRRDRKVAVQHEGRAVEHQFVLAADLIEIDQRKRAFGDARHRDRKPDIALVARVRRAVRHNQDLGAGLSETLDDVFVVLGLLKPDILADGNADADAADRERAGGGPAREQTLFVEHAVVRQVSLEADRRHAAGIEQRTGIVELVIFDPGAADQHGRPAVGGLPRQRLDRCAACRLECRFEHQVLRRVTGNEQFRQHHEIGAIGLRLRTRGTCLGGVTLDVTHRRVQLGQRDRELSAHGMMVHRIRPNCNCML